MIDAYNRMPSRFLYHLTAPVAQINIRRSTCKHTKTTIALGMAAALAWSYIWVFSGWALNVVANVGVQEIAEHVIVVVHLCCCLCKHIKVVHSGGGS